jgi:hypothetical protein
VLCVVRAVHGILDTSITLEPHSREQLLGLEELGNVTNTVRFTFMGGPKAEEYPRIREMLVDVQETPGHTEHQDLLGFGRFDRYGGLRYKMHQYATDPVNPF